MIKIDRITAENKYIAEQEIRNTIDEDLELGEVIDRLENQDTCVDGLKASGDVVRICDNDDDYKE